MRIKRFIAPDMRTALRMVREEQGPDAVILSNRPTADGIEVVAATDYDEALVQQALRSAVPGIELAVAPKPVAVAPPAPVAPAAAVHSVAVQPAAAPPRPTGRAEAMIAALTGQPAPAPEPVATPAPAIAAAPVAEAQVRDVAPPAPTPATRVQSMPAPAAPAAPATPAPADMQGPAPGDEFRAMLARMVGEGPVDAPVSAARVAATATAPQANDEHADSDDTAPAPCDPVATPVEASDAPVDAIAAPASATPALSIVATEDPALRAMRAELEAMRHLMERQLGELAVERLRGSPARAAVLDALQGYGCDEALSQAVAGRIDPRLDVDAARAAMRLELARTLTVHRAEPLDDGGVIALVGPTGAGKTTTAARLAARFAERHRARDVALVTTDAARAGAREQLHAHGRRLGVTVCEAEGPEALGRTLEQLADYPLVLVDTAGYATRDRALLGQVLWLRTARRVRSLLVLPANGNPADLGDIVRRYRPANPEGVVLTKVDETGQLGAALSVLVRNDLSLAYTSDGQGPSDIAAADPSRLVDTIDALHRAAANPLAIEDRHAVA